MRRGFLAAVAAVLLGPSVILAGPAAQGARHMPAPGFPSCVAGTYLGAVTLDLGLEFQSLSTFGADSTYVTESTIDFGAGGTAAMAFRSGGRGDWWMIGPRKLKMTYLHFAYDGEGVLLWLEKISAVLTFSGSCSSATGEAMYGIYPPGLDPFKNEPVVGGSATVTMTRLPRD